MRSLACVAVLALAAACGGPEGGDTRPNAPSPDSAELPANLSGDERPYSGEWAAQTDDCDDSRKVWTIEDNRMGVRKQRFCVFSEVRQTEGSNETEVWRADARCLAAGHESDDVLFFRVKQGRHEMRVRISDADPEELVRCPMRT
ncbi:MAG TPA: hypothetical protein PLN33_21070 [Hyphomonadaceae bacterium]|nr:hypothetical protein [Hyphomonadaceae bacterium]HPN05180.1 hypothetical protein [Hyphomonadaceae bacterium]